MNVNVIGAGLAGCEAAYQLAKRGIAVSLYECKPDVKSPAHKVGTFAELVCSNSLKSDDIAAAGGLLKAELRKMDSLLIAVADKVRVPAGSALAVDRTLFTNAVTQAVKELKNVKIINKTVDDWDENTPTVIATGPLTVGALSDAIIEKLGQTLHFYDAAAPIIAGDSIDYAAAFTGDRYGKGTGDYVNCPMTKEEYANFYEQLVNAERSPLHDFDTNEVFEGCMPVEIMAKRGFDTLRFGPLRPVGFSFNGTKPYAVVQLRKENAAGEMYNIVGFQTNLKFSEQKRVFGMIPALKNAEFLRYGVMHRNSFIDAPKVINRHFQVKKLPKTFIAGQLSGVEGYVESIASGLMCGINAAAVCSGKIMPEFPPTTIMGALAAYLERENVSFQPMNANFGILPPLENKTRDKAENKRLYAERSMKDLEKICALI
ncbi:MAG TPA: methylenetetrahydrofolate--tRNA-(uracil(54)-C(5))-methyltransferase (FADH(2)-oxidizing) TrmFO [Firmicutes bacterium]|nr:methylenetetrahydrofolate--tRNA-(uracil(54)-C(5))-methyltransferase (FADH(2)-oxidizing) TrmFO [Bacillota bacterium]